MKKIILTLLTTSILTLLNIAQAEPAQIDPKQADVLRAAIHKGRPGMTIGDIRASAIPGLFEVDITGGDTLYMPADGNYLISGTAYRIEPGKFVSIADERMKPLRAAKLAAVPVSDMVVFSPKGKPKSFITVFTDIDCGFCRKLHKEVPELNTMGIEVRYLAFPRAGVPSPSADKLATIWCSSDTKAAMTTMKSGGSIPIKPCDKNPIASQYKLGNDLGVNGTPAIFTPDGTLLPGYMPAAELAAMLGVTPVASSAPAAIAAPSTK